MKNIIASLVLICLLFISCSTSTTKDPIEQWKNEILETEQNFAVMVKDDGIHAAFLNYADENAVLKRGDTLVIGKKKIKEFFNRQSPTNKSISLTWKPDFVDVSNSGDLGYTYGQYIFSYTDSTGARITNNGVFHTVWKRQPDGTWRYVWD